MTDLQCQSVSRDKKQRKKGKRRDFPRELQRWTKVESKQGKEKSESMAVTNEQ